MKERPILFNADMVRAILDGRKTQTRRVVTAKQMAKAHGLMMEDEAIDWCPYSRDGCRRLWVRETWRPFFDEGNLWDCIEYRADGAKIKPSGLDEDTGYRFDEMCEPGDLNPHWRPSIHMPRWASRITLEVVDVRVERVKSIDHDDARKEGVVLDTVAGGGDDRYPWAFHRLWDSINAKRGRGWDVNPWVWAVTFKQVKP